MKKILEIYSDGKAFDFNIYGPAIKELKIDEKTAKKLANEMRNATQNILNIILDKNV